MACYIIADLHLQASRPELLQAFSSFVAALKAGDRLYILGDLFNFFIGLDPQDEAQLVVRQVLGQAQERGVASFFVHGNRDFLLTSREAHSLHMTLLPDTWVLSQNGINILLTHGDDFCSNDLAYQRYKRKVSNRCLQFLFRLLPLWKRRQIGHSIRMRSQDMVRSPEERELYGVVPATVAEICAHYVEQHAATLSPQRIDYVVHGHIHEFGRHEGECKDLKARLVLGAWGNMLSYCYVGDGGVPILREEPLPSEG